MKSDRNIGEEGYSYEGFRFISAVCSHRAGRTGKPASFRIKERSNSRDRSGKVLEEVVDTDEECRITDFVSKLNEAVELAKGLKKKKQSR